MSDMHSPWPPGSSSVMVDVKVGGPVHLREFGDPGSDGLVLCLHGLGGSSLNFGLLAPLLAHERRVLVPDLLGHGRSVIPRPGTRVLEAQLKMVGGLLAREPSRGPVTVVGHSLGGILAMLHAARAPASLDRLVLLDPPVPSPTRLTRDPRLIAKLILLGLPGVASLVTSQVLRMSAESVVGRQLRSATPHADRISPAAVAAAVVELRETRGEDGGRAAQRAQLRAISEVVALLARPADWRRQTAAVMAPTLWLQGEDDPLVPTAAARVFAASQSHWTFATRTAVGHLPHLEDPTGTAAMVSAWLHDQRSP